MLAQHFLKVFVCLLFVFVFSAVAFGQTKCLSEPEIRSVVESVNRREIAELDLQLQQKLLDLKARAAQLRENSARSTTANNDVERRANDAQIGLAWCEILREHGWTSRRATGEIGSQVAARVFLDYLSAEFQRQPLPVMQAAFAAGEIAKSDFAKMIDQVRVRANNKQIFGTAIGVSNDLLLLYPIENEAQVHELRREYELPELAEQIRRFEQRYQAVVMRLPNSEPKTNSAATAANRIPAAKTRARIADDEEIVRVETNLVNLNVAVLPDKTVVNQTALDKNDFRVSENGVEQQLEFFAAAETPFDLILLIDVSGSTANKMKLVRKTTRSFVKAARASDRIAILAFDEKVTTVSALTADRARLLDSVDRIRSGGGSRVWDALDYALSETFSAPNQTAPTNARRRAVVFMTDGADNGFVNDLDASATTFADLLEKVRRSETLIVPIHLDTREDYGLSPKLYRGARRALNLLADESGGLFYEARKFEDLTNVYDQVINDLGKVYSIGYSPKEAVPSNVWRAVKVELKNRPNLAVRARKGYYAR